MSSPDTLRRKKDYLEYNLSDLIPDKIEDYSVLEIGPGLGEFVSFLNDKKIDQIEVIDNDKSVLGVVSSKNKIREVYLGKNILKLHRKLGSYNLIAMIQVLEHIPLSEHKEILKFLYNHLKKEGSIVIVVPNGNNPLGLTERYVDIQHTVSFTTQSLLDLVNVSDLRNHEIEIKGFEIPPYGIINILRIFLQKTLHIFLLLIMIINGGSYFKIMTPNIMMIIRRR